MSDISSLQPGRIVDLIEADFPPEPSWIGPDILPKRCKMIFGGASGVGKSFVMLSLARALSLGEVPFDCPRFRIEKPARVLLIEHELKPFGLQLRVKPIFEDVDKRLMADTFWYVSGEPAVQFSSREGYAAMTSLVEQIKPDVLLLDPIGKMHYEDENDNGAISKLMYKIDLLLKTGADWGMSCVFSHHFGKPPALIEDNAQVRDALEPYNFRGASKWKDDPDIRVTMVEGKKIPLAAGQTCRCVNENNDHKAWYIYMRFLTRQGVGHPDLKFSVNERCDLRVRFIGEIDPNTGNTPPPKIPPQKPPGGTCPSTTKPVIVSPTPSGFAPTIPSGAGIRTYR